MDYHDEPPSYDEACFPSSVNSFPPPYASNRSVDRPTNDCRAARRAINVNDLMYSQLKYSARDANANVPDIYFDDTGVEKKLGRPEVEISSGEDGKSYMYTLIKITSEQTALKLFQSLFAMSKTSHKKASKCSILTLESHVVFRYSLTSTKIDKSKRRDMFVDYRDDYIPKEELLSVSAREILREKRSKLLPITKSNLCHEGIRYRSRLLLNKHQDGQPCIEQEQIVELFPIQIAHCEYQGKKFFFYLLGENGMIYLPPQGDDIKFLKKREKQLTNERSAAVRNRIRTGRWSDRT